MTFDTIPRLTHDGFQVIALPPVVKERLDKLKTKGTPYHAVVTMLLDEHEAKRRKP